MTQSFQDMLKPTKLASPTHVQLLVATTLHGPRRVGEWTPAEIDYAYHMSNAFKLGLFDDGIAQRKSVRLWLATLLNCSPMRLSKKFDTESNLLGKCFFNKNVAALAVMSLEERTYRYNAMEAARMRFMESIGRGSHRGYCHGIVASTRPSLGLRRPRAPDLSAAAKTVESPRSVSCTDFNTPQYQELLDWAVATTFDYDLPNLVDLYPLDLEEDSKGQVDDYSGLQQPYVVDFEVKYEL